MSAGTLLIILGITTFQVTSPCVLLTVVEIKAGFDSVFRGTLKSMFDGMNTIHWCIDRMVSL